MDYILDLISFSKRKNQLNLGLSLLDLKSALSESFHLPILIHLQLFEVLGQESNPIIQKHQEFRK
jgi:hypothetical protein